MFNNKNRFKSNDNEVFEAPKELGDELFDIASGAGKCTKTCAYSCKLSCRVTETTTPQPKPEPKPPGDGK